MDALTIYHTYGGKKSDECGVCHVIHIDILPVLCDALPVFNVLCKRVLSFLLTCINSDCNNYCYRPSEMRLLYFSTVGF